MYNRGNERKEEINEDIDDIINDQITEKIMLMHDYINDIKEQNDKLGALWDICKGYIEDNQITTDESIIEKDVLNESGYELLNEICNIVGYYEDND